MEVQEKIISIMDSHMMKQASVAKAAGFTPGVFSNMLHGRRIIRPNDIISICKALDVSPSELLDWPERRDNGGAS